MKPHFESRLFRWLPVDADAITFGRHVFFRDGLPSQSLVAHELVHVRQYAELGIPRFIALYCWDYLVGRLNGLDHKTAYRSIRFEAEAYKEHP